MNRADTHTLENWSKNWGKQYQLRRIGDPHTIEQEEDVADEQKQVRRDIVIVYHRADHGGDILHC